MLWTILFLIYGLIVLCLAANDIFSKQRFPRCVLQEQQELPIVSNCSHCGRSPDRGEGIWETTTTVTEACYRSRKPPSAADARHRPRGSIGRGPGGVDGALIEIRAGTDGCAGIEAASTSCILCLSTSSWHRRFSSVRCCPPCIELIAAGEVDWQKCHRGMTTCIVTEQCQWRPWPEWWSEPQKPRF